MNTLAAWVHTPVAQGVGWALVHFLWEGAALAAVLAAVLFLLRPSSARARYAAACLTLFAMPLAFAITLLVLLLSHQTETATAPRPPNAVAQFSVLPSLQPAPTPAPRTFRDFLPWLAPCWFLGVAFFYARGLAAWFGARRLRYRGICAPPPRFSRCLTQLCARMRLSRPVRLVESCFTDAPVLIGCLRPVILMPLGCLANLPAGQIECILIHELAHIRRHDYLVNLLQSFVEGLLFYHPAVWWASRVAREERENCCDDVVVELTGDARVYAATLAALEHRRALALQAAVAANGGSLMKRIRRLLAQPHPARVSATPAFAAGLLLVTFGAALAAWPAKPPARRIIPAVAPQARILESQTVEPQSSPLTGALLLRQDKPQTVRQPLATPYQKWLNEDVTYIITDKERASYVGLQTDEEREHFIEQFWLRRDPTPGTVGNEYREEHYRRIAYANEHFADTNLPGWKTDRGRIYITYGPPDEIEDHSAGGSYQRPASEGGGTTSTFPFQQWRYRYIEGIGNNVIVEFVDPTMRGEFHMTMDPSEKDALLHVPNAARTAKVFHSDQDPRVSVATGGAQTDSTTDATPYSIAAGDVIGVKIWEDPRFSSNYTVRPDGRISVPLLGDISAAGLTPVQLESAINQAALKFLQVAHTAVQIEHGAQRPANAANRLNALVITIGPATGQYYITAEVTGITGRTVQVVAEAVQSSPPGTFFKWLALPPGNHILRVSIRDPNGVSKSSETRFTVD